MINVFKMVINTYYKGLFPNVKGASYLKFPEAREAIQTQSCYKYN